MSRKAYTTFTANKSFKADLLTWSIITRIMALKSWTTSDVVRVALNTLALELGVLDECKAASTPEPVGAQ